jgi:hypothetical protein
MVVDLYLLLLDEQLNFKELTMINYHYEIILDEDTIDCSLFDVIFLGA